MARPNLPRLRAELGALLLAEPQWEVWRIQVVALEEEGLVAVQHRLCALQRLLLGALFALTSGACGLGLGRRDGDQLGGAWLLCRERGAAEAPGFLLPLRLDDSWLC